MSIERKSKNYNLNLEFDKKDNNRILELNISNIIIPFSKFNPIQSELSDVLKDDIHINNLTKEIKE
ncbi:MAG: hypothetical protein JXA99_12875 [Candidatus Lokiarchaeota archaeon]|nr:hypothetical protein [Candidatus Lokiarchaeota archaeon]